MDMIEVVILVVRDPLSSLVEPSNIIVIRLLCSRVDRLSLGRAITGCSRLGTLYVLGYTCIISIIYKHFIILVLEEMPFLLLR